MSSPCRAIGIDLGTFNTCVAVYRSGSIEIIPDDGYRIMPSYVAFTDRGHLVGTAAWLQENTNPQNTIFGALRFLGRSFTDVELLADMKTLPFDVVERHGRAAFRVSHKHQDIQVTPEEILAMILNKAKENAEVHLGAPIETVVITMPAYFNHFQRALLRDVAHAVGLNPSYLASNPTAAAITYTFDHWPTTEKRLLFVDFGAGTCDVTLTTIEEGIIEIRSVAGDTHLGGEDFNRRLMRFVLKDLSTNHTTPRMLGRLRSACERAKRELSSQGVTELGIFPLYDDVTILTRSRFEELCADLFLSVLEPIGRALRDAKTPKTSIDEVILLGGSARIPKIKRLISDFFDGRDLFKPLNLEESAACGAAILAAIHSGHTNKEDSRLAEFLLLDVIPLSLGIEAKGEIMWPLIRRNTTIPTKKREQMTFDPNGFSMISVFEGERARTKDNNRLSKSQLLPQTTVSPRPKPCRLGSERAVTRPRPTAAAALHKFEITMDVDAHGKIDVVAIPEGQPRSITKLHIPNFGEISSEDFIQIQRRIKSYQADARAETERIAAKTALESYLYDCIEVFRSSNRDISVGSQLKSWVDTNLSWLDEHQHATLEEYELKRVNIKHEYGEITSQVSVDKAISASGKDIALDNNWSRELPQESSRNEVPRITKVEKQKASQGSGPQEKNDPPLLSEPLAGGTHPAMETYDVISPDIRGKDINKEEDIDRAHSGPGSSLWSRLGPAEFRLLHRNEEEGGPFKLKTHKIEYPPRYRALSHVWGTQPKDRALRCSNRDGTSQVSLMITETLHNALTELIVDRVPIWVDTICINQTDDQEKGRQVALMHRIYRRADQVVIWLGQQQKDTKLALDILNWISMPPAIGFEKTQLPLFPTLQHYLQQTKVSLQVYQLQNLASVASRGQQIPITPADFQRLELPRFEDSLWNVLGIVLCPPWLFRLWTFQELMLAKDCSVVFGDYQLPWRTYFDVGMQLSLCGLLDHCLSRSNTNPDSKLRALTAFTRLEHFWNTKQKIIPFWRYLNEARYRDVTEPVDRVYGVLSLANEALRSRVKVDYSNDRKRSYWELFVETSKAMMETSTMQSVLAGANSKTKAEELPSWCPDLTVPCEVTPFGEKSQAGMGYGRSLTLHYDKRVVSIGGAQLDRVDRVMSSTWSWSLDGSEIYGPFGLAARNLRWLDKCWAYTRDAFVDDEAGAHYAFVLTILGETPLPSSVSARARSSEAALDAWFEKKDNDLIDLRRRLENIKMSTGPESLEENFPEWHRFQALSLDLDKIWRNRVFFTTKKGRIGFASDRINPGDHICLFFGESHMYILRDRPAGFHQFISDAYVAGYMAGEGVQNLPKSLAFKLN